MDKGCIYLFLDTMVYLHFAPVENIPFPKLFNSHKIVIVLPRITVAELDKHKNIHESQRIRDRASVRLNYLYNLLNEGSNLIREDVSLEYFHGPQNFDFSAHGLDSNWNDDIFIASILQFKQIHSADHIVLVSHDTGPKLSALHFGIKCVSLDEKYKLPQDEDPIIKENRQLKHELLRLQNASPQLLLGLGDLEDNQNFITFKINQTGDKLIKDKDEIIAKLRAEYLTLNPSPDVFHNNQEISDGLSKAIAQLNPNQIPASEISRYNNEIESFILEYSKYLDLLSDYHNNPKIKLELNVRNIGGAPADDIDLQITFPNIFLMFTAETLPKEPKPPKPPRKPRTFYDSLLSLRTIPDLRPFHFFEGINTAMLSQDLSHPDSFKLKQADGFVLTDHYERLKHGYQKNIRTLYIVFSSYEKANSFHFNYKISAANIPQAKKGQIDVVIEK